ncbi:calcium-binding protein [Aureimonas frigidaquae]|uniref:calcium-binding protein n=1 Tax=Aureimonas frigidaquae TaxID=424757 RepID=UPI000A4AF393
MAGGLGDDTYYVDSSGDQVVERQGEGYDMIIAKGDYALAEGVSIELLRADDMYGKVSVQLRGNAFAQTISTGNGNDTLDGRGGGDTLSGGAGDDRYTVYSTADSIVEYDREGFDVVAVQGADYALAAGTEVERIEIASSGKSRVVGNELSQTIVGNGFDNTIDGGGGNDILYGSAKGATLWSNIVKVFSPGDSDTFLFSTALGANNVDRIHNFEAGIGGFSTKVLWWTIDFPGTVIDRIGLSKSIFDTIGVGTLSDKAFCDMGKEKVSAADRILYDRNSGSIYYDVDGSGAQAAIKFAEVDAGLAMKASNFFVYA